MSSHFRHTDRSRSKNDCYAAPWWKDADPARVESVLLALGLYIRRSGAWWICRCPLGEHPDHNPSFGIRDSGYWKCFSCGQHGDLPALVMSVWNCDFREAARWLQDF